jgi:hypothetical protein
MKKTLFLFLAVPLYLLSDDAIHPSSDSEEFENRTYEFYLSSGFQLPSSNETISNSDPVCKAYVNALNKYPIIKDFFASPILPNSPEFSHPKWKQLDIYEYKDVYLMAAFSNRYTDFDAYIPNKAKLEKDTMSEDNRSEDHKERMRQSVQMYYTKADIDNDGNMDDIIRTDYGRIVIFRDAYATRLSVFKPTVPPFRYIDKNLNDKIRRADYISDIFFYKDKTYIKYLAYGLIDAGFMYMYIKGFDKNQELVPLCLITADKKTEIRRGNVK